MANSKRTALVSDAIRQALASLAILPNSEEALTLRERCLACQAVANEWSQTPPTPEEREAMMRKVIALHVAITKLRRKSERPKQGGQGEGEAS